MSRWNSKPIDVTLKLSIPDFSDGRRNACVHRIIQHGINPFISMYTHSLLFISSIDRPKLASRCLYHSHQDASAILEAKSTS